MVPRADCGPHSANRSAAVDPVPYITRHINHPRQAISAKFWGYMGTSGSSWIESSAAARAARVR